MQAERIVSHSRLLAKLTWELLRKDGPFGSVADLTDALKTRCARLHIRWTNDDITDAYRIIESNTPLSQQFAQSVEVPADETPLSPEEARAQLSGIRARLRLVPSIKSVPAVRQLTDNEVRTRVRARDQQKAARLIAKEIADAIARCEALEATVADTERC